MLLAVLSPATASAQSYELPEARVTIRVLEDGSLRISESITFAFEGSLTGAYRDIPMKPGEAVVDVGVTEGGTSYRPGAPTALGSRGEPGTFGVEDRGDVMRVVWHYRATDEVRVFTISYRMTGAAEAYDDIVDVNVMVWGDEWRDRLARLSVSTEVPGEPAPGSVRVFGHPATVGGAVSLGDDGVSPELIAYDVPPGQFVEIRFLFPTSLLTSTSGASRIEGPGLDEVLAQEAAEAQRATQEREAFRRALSSWPWFLLGSFVPALAVMAGFYVWAGREPRLTYDREYEQEPPTEHTPAVVAAMLDQRRRVGAEAFTATLFDLIRRQVLAARQVTFEKATWGGLRSETLSDLEISNGSGGDLAPHEAPVMAVMSRVLSDGPEPLSEFRDRIRDDAEENVDSYRDFQARVRDQLDREKIFDRRAAPWIWAGLGFFVLLIALGVFLGVRWVSSSPPLLVRGTLALLAAGAALVNLLLLVVFAVRRSGWVRRTRHGALMAARWTAFRRYLKDFSRLEEAPPASLTLWEEFLVYGIALGVAEDVLRAARLQAPPVVEQSSLYWFGTDGYSGGLTGDAISGIEKSLAGAFTPPSSGSSGSGGGFTGSGGGGSGGGGGGAW